MGLTPGSAVCYNSFRLNIPSLFSVNISGSSPGSPSQKHGSSSSGMLPGVSLGLCTFPPRHFAPQLWRMSSHAVYTAVPLQPSHVHSSLGCWQQRQFDFHSGPTHALKGTLCHRAGQEDSRKLSHAGLLAAVNCSAYLRAYNQGTGFVVTVGADHRIIMELSAPVGGPVASLAHCSEAAGPSLFFILQKVKERYNGHLQLMIFIDCLALLMILSKWGQTDFLPDPGDVIHFDVIFPLIEKL